MEVNLALLIMAVGMLGLFSLFPVGLRQSNAASSDTTQAAFATLVLNAMRANAQAVTNWNDWLVLTNGVELGVAGYPPTTGGVMVYANGSSTPVMGNGIKQVLNDYLVKDQYLEYALHVCPNSNPLIIDVWIQISTRRYTDLTRTPKYATSFVYMGM
jgi:hypothetical protein